MPWLTPFTNMLKHWSGRSQFDHSLNEELRLHIEERTDELGAGGLTRADAETLGFNEAREDRRKTSPRPAGLLTPPSHSGLRVLLTSACQRNDLNLRLISQKIPNIVRQQQPNVVAQHGSNDVGIVYLSSRCARSFAQAQQHRRYLRVFICDEVEVLHAPHGHYPVFSPHSGP